MLNAYTSILITGGTGSFGQAFIKKVLTDYPNIRRVVIFSRDEYKQYLMLNEQPFKGNPRLRFFIGDVRDRERLFRAFNGIDVVIHAAALKQIPSCEYNPFEAIKTNVYGAQNVIDAAIDRNVKKVVALSTDKACSPINLYGATKLCSDKLFVAANAYSGHHKTIFAVVRYGNVAGSRGSVIPYFKELIQSGAKTIPITDIRMTRFYLELPEAIKLVMTALKSMKGGELYIKKLPSIKIVDLAAAMAPGLPVTTVGIRPGEKIHEMMINIDDAARTYDLGDYYIIAPHDDQGLKFGAKGHKVPLDFEYHSGNNPWKLNRREIKTKVQTFLEK